MTTRGGVEEQTHRDSACSCVLADGNMGGLSFNTLARAQQYQGWYNALYW
jgi:hypothetical protein